MRATNVSAREWLDSGRTTPERNLRMLFKSTLPLRFWQKVYADDYGCWLWTGALSVKCYGLANLRQRSSTHAHRLAYEDFVGPIPDGLQIDHLCRIRPCVRPDHLEPVTAKENVRRGTVYLGIERERKPYLRTFGPRGRMVCINGHALDRETTVPYRGTTRILRSCTTCHAARQRAYWQRRKAKKLQ